MDNKKCSIWWCNKPHYAKGYCKAHWVAIRRFGSPYGRKSEQMRKVDENILMARLLAIRIIEYVNKKTEFEHKSTEFEEITSADNSKPCEFCGSYDGGHKPLCIVVLSRALLDNTANYDIFNLPEDAGQLLDDAIKNSINN